MDENAPSPAGPSEGSPDGAPAPTPAETAAAGLKTLSADREWQSDFNGDNGRPAQLAAVKLKSETTRAAFNSEPDTASALPEKIESGLNSPDPAVRAVAEGLRPGETPDDYSFQWGDVSSISLDDLKSMNEIASEAAFSIGANPGVARSTVKFIEKQLAANTSGAEITPEQLDTALADKFGGEADGIAAMAVEVVAQMPAAGKAWFTSALKGLDPSSAALVVGKLARVAAANAPKA